ncbi:MAG: hypothetical protein ACLU6O_14190 [Bilophila wadsworthia]
MPLNIDGVTPTTDMEVVRSEPETAPGPTPCSRSAMTESGVLFKGTHVSEVLAGAERRAADRRL